MLTGSIWTIWLVFVVMHVFMWVPYGTLFYLRRHRQPLKGSRPNIIMLANIGGIVFSLIVLLVPLIGEYMNAYATLNIGGLFLGMMFDCYVVLAATLYFAFKKTMVQLELQSKRSDRHTHSITLGIDSIRKYAYLLTDRCAYLYVLANAILYNVPLYIYAVYEYPAVFSLSFDVAFKNMNFTKMNGITSAKLVIANILQVIIAFQIRMIKDEIGIKKLLKRTAIAGALCFSVFWCVVFLNATYKSGMPLEMVVGVIGIDAVFILSIVVPVRRSYRPHRISTSDLANQTFLEAFLKTPTGFEAFKQHLQKEFAVENVMFWHDAEVFRIEFATSGNNREKAERIFQMYIQKNAPFMVNLDSRNFAHYNHLFGDDRRSQSISQIILRQSILFITNAILPENTSKHPDSPEFLKGDLFQRASRQLLMLMESDSLPRFLHSPGNRQLWQDYIAGLKEQVIHNLVNGGTDENVHLLLK